MSRVGAESSSYAPELPVDDDSWDNQRRGAASVIHTRGPKVTGPDGPALVVTVDCATCGRHEYASPKSPAWAQVSGFEACVQWLDTPGLPTPGARSRLHVGSPFRANEAEPFWALYMPPLSFLNGWEEHPEEIEATGIVECRLREDLGPDGRGRQVVVEVLRSVSLGAIPSTFPAEASPQEASLPWEPTHPPPIEVLRWKGFTVRSWNAESDLGGWAIYMKLGSQFALILTGSWGFHESAIAAGCRLLSAKEARELGLR